MTATPRTCTCTESSSREVRTDRHTHTTHTHTCKGVARPGTTGDAPRHMHTWLDRQAAGSVSTGSPSRRPREAQHGAQSCLRGAALPVPLGHRGVLGLVPGGKPSVLLSTGSTASPGPSKAARSPLLATRQTHRVLQDFPLQPVGAVALSSPHHSLSRVSMPLGGKYKRCLCLKPNMGVGGSPGLCPSCGPGLLATEGWAETRGRPPSYAQYGSCVCSPCCPALHVGGDEQG